MTWYLSPSGWPTHADDGSLFAERLAAHGWLVIDESQVAAAVAAYNAGGPPAPPAVDFFDTEVASLVPGPSATATALRAAFGSGTALAARRHSTVDQSVTPPVDFSLLTVTLGGTSFNSGMDLGTANAIVIERDGPYMVAVAVSFEGGGVGPRVVCLMVNGSSVREWTPPADTNATFKVAGSELIDLYAGNVVTLAVYVGGSGAAITLNGDAPKQTSLALTYLGPFA